MATFDDSEREYLVEMRALDVDANGVEVLVGLTAEETDAYLRYARSRVGGPPCLPSDKPRYLDLHDKHEAARVAVLVAEAELRAMEPPIH